MPRISELNPTAFPNLGHEFPASRDGETVKLTVAQVRALMAFAANEITAPGDLTVEQVLTALANDKADRTYVDTQDNALGTAVASKADATATANALAKRVRVDAAQTFTTPEKLQARTNLGLYPQAWELIADDFVSNVASWDAINLGDYRELCLIFTVTPENNSQNARVLVSSDNGASFDGSAGMYQRQYILSSGSSNLVGRETNASSVYLAVGIGNAGAFGWASGKALLANFNRSEDTYISVGPTSIRNDTSEPTFLLETGYRQANAANNAIRVIFDTGNIARGQFTLLGIRG